MEMKKYRAINKENITESKMALVYDQMNEPQMRTLNTCEFFLIKRSAG